MKRMKPAVTLWIIWLVLLSPVWCGAQNSGFILLSSTIGSIDSGIVGRLDNEFEYGSPIFSANPKEWRQKQCLKKSIIFKGGNDEAE